MTNAASAPDDAAFHQPTFLGLDAEAPTYADAKGVVLPIPFERTTSYGSGTARGPAALLEASAYVELYDQELDDEPCRHGIYTAPAFEPKSSDLAIALKEIEAEARRHLEAGKFLVTLGGEHSLTLAPVRAAASILKGSLGVVQFDAHADLRDSYEGTRHSHAAVMRRVVDDVGAPTVAVGIRSLSSPEAQLIADRQLPVIWGRELDNRNTPERFISMIDRLPDDVYLTFDIDFFDPGLVPATGTPEPGGGTWHQTLQLLRLLFERKRVLAMDVVELAPWPGMPASDFVAAKLTYKCFAYKYMNTALSDLR